MKYIHAEKHPISNDHTYILTQFVTFSTAKMLRKAKQKHTFGSGPSTDPISQRQKMPTTILSVLENKI